MSNSSSSAIFYKHSIVLFNSHTPHIQTHTHTCTHCIVRHRFNIIEFPGISMGIEQTERITTNETAEHAEKNNKFQMQNRSGQ